MRKDQGLNILQCERQARLINGSLHATVNDCRKVANKVFFRNLNQKIFHCFLSAISKILRKFS